MTRQTDVLHPMRSEFSDVEEEALKAYEQYQKAIETGVSMIDEVNPIAPPSGNGRYALRKFGGTLPLLMDTPSMCYGHIINRQFLIVKANLLDLSNLLEIPNSFFRSR